jgi:hypothetical protein
VGCGHDAVFGDDDRRCVGRNAGIMSGRKSTE